MSLSVGKLDLMHVKLAHLLGSGKGLVKLKLLSSLETENLSPVLPMHIQAISPPPQGISKL